MSTPQPLLDAQNIHRSYGSRTILGGVSFSIHAKDRVGLVGNNGTGKSTLCRILAGEEAPDLGVLARRKDATFAYLPQEPALDPEQSALQNVLSGLKEWWAARSEIDRLSHSLDNDKDANAYQLAVNTMERLGGWDVEHRARSMLGNLGIPDVEAVVRNMSGGERRRVALAALLVAKPDLAILDEPTNHLDIETVDWLETYLEEEHEGALLLITHDRYFLNRVASRTVELANAQLYVYEGGYEDYLEQKAVREELAARTERNRQNYLRKELEWLRRTPAARTGKQKARIQRANTAIQEKAPPVQARAVLQTGATRSGSTILEADHLRLGVPSPAGQRVLVNDLTFALCKGDRVGIVGHNGAGKTTLLGALTATGPAAHILAGRVVRGQNTQFAYLNQARTGLVDDRTVYENVAGATEKVGIGERQGNIRSLLEKLMFDTHAQMQPVASLSGGERARVLLAKMLLETSNLMVLDEPTNDLDVGTLSAIEEMLLEFDGTALIVTHDRWFLDRVATHILAFDRNTPGNVVMYAGNYSMYKALLAANSAGSAKGDNSGANPTSSPSTPPKKKKALSYKEKLEYDGLLEQIAAQEARVQELESKLADPGANGVAFAELGALADALTAAKDEAERMTQRWVELDARAT